MYSRQALLDIHERAHRSLQKLLIHCRQFSPAEINREMEGFGYPTIRLQLHHVIGAEEYWVKVLQGRVEADDNDAAFPSIEALEAWRAGVAAATGGWLQQADADAINQPRKLKTWGNREATLTPAHVIVRTQTHIFHHMGQVVAMCRQLGKPAGGMDFPLL